MNWLIFSCMMIYIVCYSAGEYYSKLWTYKPSAYYVFMVLFTYAIACAAWLPALKSHGSVTILSTIFSLAGLVSGIVVGVLIFSEPVTIKQWAGIVLSFVAFLLLC